MDNAGFCESDDKERKGWEKADSKSSDVKSGRKNKDLSKKHKECPLKKEAWFQMSLGEEGNKKEGELNTALHFKPPMLVEPT